MVVYTWDTERRFKNDPCACKLCQRVQKVVVARSATRKLFDYYKSMEVEAAQEAVLV